MPEVRTVPQLFGLLPGLLGAPQPARLRQFGLVSRAALPLWGCRLVLRYSDIVRVDELTGKVSQRAERDLHRESQFPDERKRCPIEYSTHEGIPDWFVGERFKFPFESSVAVNRLTGCSELELQVGQLSEVVWQRRQRQRAQRRFDRFHL